MRLREKKKKKVSYFGHVVWCVINKKEYVKNLCLCMEWKTWHKPKPKDTWNERQWLLFMKIYVTEEPKRESTTYSLEALVD